MRLPTLLLAAFAALVVATSTTALAFPVNLDALQSGARPTDGTKTLYLNLSGTGSLPRNQTGDTFVVTVNVTGGVAVHGNNGGGNGRTFQGSDLAMHVKITYKDDQGNTHVAEEFDATTSIHGEYASYLGQGLDGFRFNLEMQGRAGPILHVGLHGNTTGLDNGTYMTVADGNANVKHTDGADNYLVALTGTAELRDP